MAIVEKLDQAFVDRHLQCREGVARAEFVDPQRTGLYIEVRATSPGQGTYYLRYKDRNGKTCHQKIAKTTEVSLAEARKRARDLKAEIQLGADPRGEHKAKASIPTLSAYWDDAFFPHIRPRLRSWAKLQGMWRLRVQPRFGDVRIDQLKRLELQAFHAELVGQGLSEVTADHHLKLVRQMLNLAVEWGILAVNPVGKVKLFNPDNRILGDFMTPAELARLLAVLRTHENRPVCNLALFLLATGARLNEALSAKWEHIDRASRTWRVPPENSKSKRIRSIVLNDAAIEVLDALGTEGKSPQLFVSDKTKKPLRWVHKSFERLKLQADLPRLRIHTLRKQFALHLLESGKSIYHVSRLLGHSSVQVTEQRYAALSAEALFEAANSASVFTQMPKPACPKEEPAATTEVATTAVEEEVRAAA